MAAIAAPQSLRERIGGWILKRRGPDAAPLTLTHRRIFILPSRAGYGFALLLLTLLVASINYSLSLGYVLTFFLVAVGWVSLHLTHRNLSRLVLSPRPCTPVFAGERVCVVIHAESLDIPRYAIGVKRTADSGIATAAFVDIGKESSAELTLELPVARRGIFRPGRLEVFTRYPLGLFHAWTYVDFGQTAVVYPKPHPSAGPLPQARGEDADEGAPARGDDEFAGLRDYRPGDNLRRIAWKSLARGQGLASKDFHGYQSGELLFDPAETPGANIEERLSRITAWVLETEAMQRAYGLRIGTPVIGPAVGPAHHARCLEALALHGITGNS